MNAPLPHVLEGHAPVEIRWRTDLDVLVVEYRGRRGSPEHMASCWHAVRDLAASLRIVKVLAIDLMDDEPFVGEQRETFMRALGPQTFVGRRWAFVARSVDCVGAYEATQLDAQAAGLEVRIFGSRSEAELWVRFAE